MGKRTDQVLCRRGFIKDTLTITSGMLLLNPVYALAKPASERLPKGNPYNIHVDQIKWVKEQAFRILKGCKVRAYDGTWLFTPDGVGHYGALWTRDLYYMLEYGGDLLDPVEVKEAIYYLLRGQREDGCIPDRMNLEGHPIYGPGAPGKPIADHALDNGSFMAMLVCSYVSQHGDPSLFLDVQPQIQKGLEQIEVSENGLVYSDPNRPLCGYGFSDIVKKTGHLLFSSLLFYKANLDMYHQCTKLGCGNVEIFKKRCEAVRRNVDILWNSEKGMYWAADIDCKQIDVWASVYAAAIGIANKSQTQRIAQYLTDHYDEIVYRGQVRHLAENEGEWEKLFIKCKPGTYENGAYWALPLAWMLPYFDMIRPGLSRLTLESVISDFQQNGIHECINKDYAKLPDLVVSILSIHSLVR